MELNGEELSVDDIGSSCWFIIDSFRYVDVVESLSIDVDVVDIVV